MNKWKILRRMAMVLSLLMLITSTVNTTYGFLVTSTEPLVNVFTPEHEQTSGVVVEKTVAHPFGDTYKMPDNIVFDFKIELGSYYANEKLLTSYGELRADSRGNLTVEIKPGKPLEIDGIRQGTVVKVSELDTSLDGFTVMGEASKQLTVDANGNAKFSFINKYTPSAVKPGNVTVKGVKILEGREWKEGDAFSFKLERKINGSWAEVGVESVRYSATATEYNKFDFSSAVQGIEFDRIGEYEFRMSEIEGSLEHVDYDKTINTFKIKVTDNDMDGKLEINSVTGEQNAKVTTSGNSHEVYVTFNNSFDPPDLPDPEPIEVEIKVEKDVINLGELTSGKSGFEFVLENTDTREKTALRSDYDGKATFTLSISRAGNYRYTLSESNEGKAGMEYDDTVYSIEITVVRNDQNVLVPTVKIGNDTASQVVLEFVNKYTASKPVTPPTNDTGMLPFWIIMMVISSVSFASLWIYDRKKNVRV